ncbi:MAG: DUF2318 domain-containing protein [Bifidobacteriaceae bacterium]|jgi:uncharacterized membrane protein|nr:DUF2318 domain-containing protein [Bifidobacteriaceae bacterium]
MLGQVVAVTGGLAPAILLIAVIAVGGRCLGLGRKAWRLVAGGVAAGTAGGAALAVIREVTGMAGREVISIATLSLLLAAMAALAVASWLPRRRAPRERADGPSGEGRAPQGANATPTPLAPDLGGAWTDWVAWAWAGAAGAVAALTLFRAVPPVLLQWSSFVVPGTSAASTDSLMRILGFVLGATLAVLVGVFVARASDGVSRAVGRVGLTAAVAVGGAGNLIGLMQLLVARRWIELPRPVFKALSWGINHGSVILAGLAVAALIPPLAMLRANRRPPTGGPNPAVDRLAKARARRRIHYGLASAASYLAIGWVVTFGVAIDQREPQLSPPEQFDVAGALAVIDLDAIDDGHLHRFAYTTSTGVEVRFIVVKKNGVAYGVGLDACEVCGPTGYYEKDGKIICRLCDVIMNIATIGFKGGCNPIPLDYELDGGQLTVALADLEAAADVFA